MVDPHKHTKGTSPQSWSWRPPPGPGSQCSNSPSSCSALGKEECFLPLLQGIKREKKQQEGEGKQLLDRNAAERKEMLFLFLFLLCNAFVTLDRNRVKPLYKRKEVAVWESKKKEEPLYNEAMQVLWANNHILHLDFNSFWRTKEKYN